MTYNPINANDIFQCRKCGTCCHGYGGTYLSPRDITAIANYIHENPDTFVEKFCRLSGSRPVIRQNREGYCVFWDQLCTIHPVKPKMCRSWPFIRPVLADIRNWEIMAGSCPGIRTGFPDEVIRVIIQKKLDQDSEP